LDERGYVVVDSCACLLLRDHDGGCVCAHDVERRVGRVDAARLRLTIYGP
jgi:hypothetical protein